MSINISVIGLGYAGLPVAVAFGKQGHVIGFDINENRITELKAGLDSTHELEMEEIISADIHFTSNPEDLGKANFHIISVPTPINEAKQPDLDPLLSATEMIGRVLKPGDIVVYESTVYPGCTEENCVPILENCSGLKYFSVNSNHTGMRFELSPSDFDEGRFSQEGFYLGYSPERVNPGDKEHTFTSIQKVVSGSTPKVADLIAEVYSSVVSAGVYRASSIKVAEAAKVIENAQRDLNIAFVNELALIFNQLGIDTSEVLEAAGTKWNFLPFRPGLVGGHCIGVDPYYLTYIAERFGYNPQVILAGRCINDGMGIFVAEQTVKKMATAGIGAVGSIVTVLGLTFKEDCTDLRNSRVPDIVTELNIYGSEVQVYDPWCDPKEAWNEFGIKLCNENELQPASAVVLAVAHQQFQNLSMIKWQRLLNPKAIVVDIKKVAPAKELENAGYLIWRL